LTGGQKNFSPVLEPNLGDPGRRVFENRMLRKTFVRRKDNAPGEWRKFHNEELHNLYYYPPKGRFTLSVKLSDFTV